MSTPHPHQEVVVLDFGSQYTHLLARRIRELGVFSRIVPADSRAANLTHAIGIILSGGPQSVIEERIRFDRKIFTLGKPLLGICYGHQLLAHALGGDVRPGTTSEYGIAQAQTSPSGLFSGCEKIEQVWMSHGDSVTRVPDGFVIIGRTPDCPVAAMADERRKMYGLQFHPEVTHTTHGRTILKNFVLDICAASQDWTMVGELDELRDQITRQVGSKNVFLLVSGGVDSTVCFALLQRALDKDRVYGLHVDSGLMRLHESAEVEKSLRAAGFGNLHVVDASQRFFSALRGITDPEQKRLVIGSTFLRVKEDALHTLHLDPEQWILAQGTIYPDTIETGRTQHADVIKTHHNRIPELQTLAAEGKIIEPLKDLYKDEVRRIGELLGLPKSLVWRHPFPGPGLGIRVLCSDGREVMTSSQDSAAAQSAVQRLIGSDCDAEVLPFKSVGVQGDQRTYRHALVVFGTQDITRVGNIAPQLTNELSAINRVLVAVGGNTGTWSRASLHEAFVDQRRVELLQRIDHDINSVVEDSGLKEKVWQFPIVLVPFGIKGGETIILRPIWSQEAMTANYFAFPGKVIEEIVKSCRRYDEISFILYDVTNKPPATIEWE